MITRVTLGLATRIEEDMFAYSVGLCDAIDLEMSNITF